MYKKKEPTEMLNKRHFHKPWKHDKVYFSTKYYSLAIFVWTILLISDSDNNTLLQNVGINIFILEENNASFHTYSN